MWINYYIGIIYGNRLEYEKSIKYGRENRRLAKEIGNKSNIAFSNLSLGDHFWQAKNSDSARFYFDNALKLFEELDDKRKISHLFYQLGLIDWLVDLELDRALAMFEKSYNLYSDHGTLATMGEIYLRKNEFDKALENYDKALKYFIKVESKFGIAYLNRLYGQYYRMIHDYENQIKSYKISYELYSELRVEREKAQSLAGLIVALRNIGDEKSLQKYFEKSLEINTNGAPDFYIELGFFHMLSGHLNFARDCFLKQLELEKENNNSDGIINTYTNIGLSYFYEDDFKNALQYFNNSVNHNGIKSLYHTSETLIYKHLCEKKLGMPLDDSFLKQYIDKKMETNKEWFKQEPIYLNWALYTYFGHDEYILESKRQLDFVLDNTPTVNVKKVSSYPIYQKILESFNQMQNL